MAAKPNSAATPQIQMPRPEQGPEGGVAAMTPKNFRNHPDMENFFRFIYENDLRHEALEIIDQIIIDRKARKRKTPAGA